MEKETDINSDNIIDNAVKQEKDITNGKELDSEQEHIEEREVNTREEGKVKDNGEEEQQQEIRKDKGENKENQFSNGDQVEKQVSNDNIELNKQNESNNQRSTNNEQYAKQRERERERESNDTEEKKTDHNLLENLSNDSFEKKFNILHDKLFNRPGRGIITEDKFNLNMNPKGLTVNPKLEEIFEMIEAKDFKRELRELNKKPENIPDTRLNKFEIRNIHNYSPLKEIRYLSQNQNKKVAYTSAIQPKTNNPFPKYDQFKSKNQTVFRTSVDSKEKKSPSSSIVIEKIVPRKRDPLFNKDYFKAKLTSLNQKLFGNELPKIKKGINSKENFYL